MADVTVWEGGDVKCKVRLEGKKYKSTTTVEFVFVRKDNDEELETVTATVKSHLLSSKTAECVWKATKTKDTELFYVAKYYLKIDGTKQPDIAQDVYVWAKEMTVTTKKPDGGGFPAVICNFSQDVPESMRKKLGNVSVLTARRRGDNKGKITYSLQIPVDVTTVLERPYEAVGAWTTATGRAREVKVKQGFKAKIDWPIADVTSGEHAQWVNVDAKVGTPEFGSLITIKIGSTFTAPGEPGDTVHIRAKFSDNNSDRTARDGEHAKGAEVTTTVKLDANRKATFQLQLGPGGGELVTINVGATAQANDATVKVRSWRKLYYQLKGPDFIAATLPVKVLPDASNGYDLPAGVTAHVKKILDKTFTTYEVLKSFNHAANLYSAHQRVPSQFIGRPAGTTVLVQTTNDYNTDHPTAFAAPDDRTILIKLCDMASNGNTEIKTVEKTFTAASTNIAFTTDYGSLYFEKLPLDGTDAFDVTGCEWEADVTGLNPGTVDAPGADAAHPAFDNFVARKGAMNKAWIRPNNMCNIRVVLPSANATDPGKFVGPAGTALKCPIKIKFFVTVPAGWINGCALGNRQLMCMVATAPKCVGSTLCHELAHTMGMSIMPSKNKVPYGLAAPKHVDNGGTYYRNIVGTETVGNGLRNSHQGPHCAEGIADKTPASLAGKGDATCVLYGEGGNDDNLAPITFCATCVKYLKARNLDDIQTSFQTRAAEDC